MNTLFFKYALEVEHTHSITQAAENMFMAQPNLSRAIKEMEDTLGFVIFERTPKGVVPTAKGKTFLVYARNIVHQLQKMETINKEPGDDGQSFSISIPRSSYISESVTNFAKDLDLEKQLKLNIMETDSIKTINNIASSKFKLGIIRYQSDNEPYFKSFLKDKHIVSDIIWEYECLAAFSKRNPLAEATTLHREDFKDQIEICHGDVAVPYIDSAQNKDLTELSSEKKIYLYERCTQFDILTKIPISYMWVSPIPEALINKYGLVQRKCSFPQNSFKDVLIYSDSYKLTDLDKKYIEHLYESKTEVCYKNYN